MVVSDGTCVFCAEPVTAERDYQEVMGFVRQRDQGGANAIRDRKPTGRWACRWCVEKLAKGLDPGQRSLV